MGDRGADIYDLFTEPPKSPPTIYQAVFAIAKLGGFLGRKSDGNPGLEVMWRGIIALENMVEIYSIFKGKDVGNV